MTDDYAPDPGTKTPEQAFRAEYEFNGTTLKPFSFVRETAAHALGWKMHLPEQDADEKDVTQFTRMLWDATLIVWLCSQPDSVAQRARRLPREYEGKVDDWADKHGVTMNSDAGAEVMRLYAEILSDYFSSQSEPKHEEGGSKETEDPN